MFVNREAELADLEERYRSARAEMYVLYCRRRVSNRCIRGPLWPRTTVALGARCDCSSGFANA